MLHLDRFSVTSAELRTGSEYSTQDLHVESETQTNHSINITIKGLFNSMIHTLYLSHVKFWYKFFLMVQ